mmetsp:Transcript_37212/g.81808  ORF Transcript_37212/g.81808 Transcript_37212/m.81808 type:complete len:286 (+) Transcript_37212:231-1088(+)
MQIVNVSVPHGVRPGTTMQFTTPDGQTYQTTVPPHVTSGGTFAVQVPSAAPQPPVPMGLPLEQPNNPPLHPQPPPLPSQPPLQTSSRHPAFAPRPYQPQQPQQPEFPSPPMAMRQVSLQAVKHAECPICFEKLHVAPCGVFLDESGRRVSPDYYNLEAAREWLRTGNGHCPMTRRPVSAVREVPDLSKDPDGWFEVVDLDGDGKLSRAEAISALKAQLPLDNAALDAALVDPQHTMWRTWDADGSGSIERSELLAPNGLAAYVRRTFEAAQNKTAIPDMRTDKAG